MTGPRRLAGVPANLLLSLASLVVFVILAEGLLWAVGVQTLLTERDPFAGFSRRVPLFAPDEARGLLVTPASAVNHSFNYQEFLAVKPEHGFRLFTLGGSSAVGFPWGAQIAFTAVLGRALEGSLPGRTIETVNAAAMSYGSQRMRVLAHELVRYRPDVIVIYEAHNEFVEKRFYREVVGDEGFGRLRGLLYRSRIYSGLTRALGRAPGATSRGEEALGASTTGELVGLDVAREDAAGTRQEEKDLVGRRLEENLRAIVELARGAGATPVLCTVASNVKDWPPNQSLFDSEVGADQRAQALQLQTTALAELAGGNGAQAVSHLERAAQLGAGHAGLMFDLGRAYEAVSRWEDARRAYSMARDLDAQPARALTSFNETIRRVAAQTGSPLVDVERVFEADSPNGLVGLNLITDYVHPTARGHWLIARELWTLLVEKGLVAEPRRADSEEFLRIVGEPAEGDVATAGLGRGGEGSARPAIWLYSQGLVLEQHGLVEQGMDKYRACLELEPGYFPAAYNLARLLHAQGHPDLAIVYYERALAAEPNHLKSMLGLAMALVRQREPARAEEILKRATRLDPGSSMAWNALGHTQVLQGKPEMAETSFRKAIDLDPANADALCNLGLALGRRGRKEEGAELLRAALKADPGHQRARAALAVYEREHGHAP